MCGGAPTTVSGRYALQREGSETPSFSSAFFLPLLLESMGTVFGAPAAKGLLTGPWEKTRIPSRVQE